MGERLWLAHRIAGKAGELPSAGYFLTNKGNQIRSSLTPACQQTLRGELSVLLAPAVVQEPRSFALYTMPTALVFPKCVLPVSAACQVKREGKNNYPKILIDGQMEHTKMLSRIILGWSWLQGTPHLATKRASPVLRVNIRVPRPVFISPLQPHSRTRRDDYIEADL